jgi:hypothetical protein
MRLSRLGAALMIVVASAGAAAAQTDDTPSIRVGVEVFPDFTYTLTPTTIDSDNNSIHLSQFNLTRSYINITGKLSHLIGFRVTPDVARETSSFSNLQGSLEMRITYAYLELNLDDWMTAGSYGRFGLQPTPWLLFAESIYRYRFQGAMFPERDGYLTVADAGASFHYNLPSNYGDIHVGVFNGDGANKSEVNDQKSLQVRATVRPFGGSSTSILRGILASVFFDDDRYVRDGPRHRSLASLMFEHPFVHAGFEYLDTADRPTTARPEIDGRGYSVWVTPRTSKRVEGLIRYDHLKPNTLVGAQVRNRTIVGVAYWFPHQGDVSSALLLDYDGQTFDGFTPALPKQSKLAVHGLIRF